MAEARVLEAQAAPPERTFLSFDMKTRTTETAPINSGELIAFIPSVKLVFLKIIEILKNWKEKKYRNRQKKMMVINLTEKNITETKLYNFICLDIN